MAGSRSVAVTARPGRFVALVPVKPPSLGKSRLGDLPSDQRRELATAFALDAVTAALGTPGVAGVLAVTDDFRFAARLTALGCDVIPDGASDDLNATLVQAAAEATRRWPDAMPVALCADLPCLLPHELAEVLVAAAPGRASFVRDSAGTGTTVYVAPTGSFAPRFGPGSAELHAAAGALEIAVPAPSVRHDVDDLADLAAALVRGVGAHTAAVIGRG
jgi:2-phospho-L-lactate/phosphoenolpyruvate guanylyltransferase